MLDSQQKEKTSRNSRAIIMIASLGFTLFVVAMIWIVGSDWNPNRSIGEKVARWWNSQSVIVACSNCRHHEEVLYLHAGEGPAERTINCPNCGISTKHQREYMHTVIIVCPLQHWHYHKNRQSNVLCITAPCRPAKQTVTYQCNDQKGSFEFQCPDWPEAK